MRNRLQRCFNEGRPQEAVLTKSCSHKHHMVVLNR